MLNEFLSSVKGSLADQLTENTDVESDKLDGVANVVTDTFKEGIVGKFKDGQIGDIVGLLGKGGSSSPFAGNLVNNVVGSLVSKLGLPKGISTTVANVAVPFIIDKLGAFASEKGKDNEDGVKDLLGDLVMGSVKDKLLGGLGKKFGF
jgi:hypothetical protein